MSLPVPLGSGLPEPHRRVSYRTAACVVTSVFFVLGFITTLNDILVPHLRTAFALSFTQAMLVQFTFFGAYLIVSLPAGKVVMRVGYQGALVTGLLLSATGALCSILPPACSRIRYFWGLCSFWPAASSFNRSRLTPTWRCLALPILPQVE